MSKRGEKSPALSARNIGNKYGQKYDDPTVCTRNQLIDRYRQDAKKRKLNWGLTPQECVILFKSNCVYCDAEPYTITKAKGPRKNNQIYNYTYTGLDRVNNNHGYTASNVVPCCPCCNGAKTSLIYSDFVKWVSRLVNHQNRIRTCVVR